MLPVGDDFHSDYPSLMICHIINNKIAIVLSLLLLLAQFLLLFKEALFNRTKKHANYFLLPCVALLKN